MLAIFGFRKNRNQSLSNQGPQESEAEVSGDGCPIVATAPMGFVCLYIHTSHHLTLKRIDALSILHPTSSYFLLVTSLLVFFRTALNFTHVTAISLFSLLM